VRAPSPKRPCTDLKEGGKVWCIDSCVGRASRRVTVAKVVCSIAVGFLISFSMSEKQHEYSAWEENQLK
jgi:hypothetical protein